MILKLPRWTNSLIQLLLFFLCVEYTYVFYFSRVRMQSNVTLQDKNINEIKYH